MSRSLLMRMLENFFRRWYLYLIPVVLLGVLGFLSVSKTQSSFKSIGTFNVESSTVLGSLTGSADPGFGYDTPAAATSKRIMAQLQTDQFVNDIASRAGLSLATSGPGLTAAKVRSGIAASANGSNLVQVSASAADPNVAQKLAASTIAVVHPERRRLPGQPEHGRRHLLRWADHDVPERTSIKPMRALNDYIVAHPVSALGVRPA